MTQLTDNTILFSSSGHLTQEQLMNYHSGEMSKEDQHLVEEHLVDCELCRDALAGMAFIPGYKGIERIRKEIRQIARPKRENMNKIAWRIVILTAAVLGIIILIVLYYLYFINNMK